MIFVEGLERPEAPVLMTSGDWLVAEMASGTGKVTKISHCGKRRETFAEIGRPNGLLLDKVSGCVWVAETWEPSLIKLNPDDSVACRITGGDKPFLWPNDLVFGPDGCIYMTDSGVLVKDLVNERGLDPKVWDGEMQGRLYRINPEDNSVKCLDEGFRFTNGIAFGPDGALYVNEMVTGHVYRYPFNGSLEVERRELFASVIDGAGPNRVVGPDGMTFDEQGNLYIALFGQGHIATVRPDGTTLRAIVTRGSCPTNVTFGPPGSKQLYITEYQRGRMEVVDMESDGYFPEFG